MHRVILFLALFLFGRGGEVPAASPPTPTAPEETPTATPTPEPTATPSPSPVQGRHHAGTLEEVLHHYPHLDASRSLVDLLELLPRLSGLEHALGRFLIANALAELGFYRPSLIELGKLQLLPTLSPAASVELCRILAETGDDQTLLQTAKRADWRRLEEDDRGEIAYRAARAAFRLQLYSDTRRWLVRVPASSSFAPFATYLLAQTELAMGRYPQAIAAADRLLRQRAGSQAGHHLQDRAAILLGDLLTEIGLYSEASQVLRWPSPRSPYAARAGRDQLVASGLGSLARGEFDDAEPVIDRLHAYLQNLQNEVAEAVGSEALVVERAKELRREWPPKYQVYARREWAARHAGNVLASLREDGSSGMLKTLWDRLNAPVELPWLSKVKPDPWLPKRDVKSRFFFPPSPRLSNLLVGLSLLEDRPVAFGEDCTTAAATAIRQRIASSLLEEAEPPSEADLRSLAKTCTLRDPDKDLLRHGTLRLHEAILEESSRVQQQLRREELELERAIATAYLRQKNDLEASRSQKKPPGDEEPAD